MDLLNGLYLIEVNKYIVKKFKLIINIVNIIFWIKNLFKILLYVVLKNKFKLKIFLFFFNFGFWYLNVLFCMYDWIDLFFKVKV